MLFTFLNQSMPASYDLRTFKEINSNVIQPFRWQGTDKWLSLILVTFLVASWLQILAYLLFNGPNDSSDLLDPFCDQCTKCNQHTWTDKNFVNKAENKDNAN